MDRRQILATIITEVNNHQDWLRSFMEICENHISDEYIFDEQVALCEEGRGEPPPRVHNYLETVVDLYTEIQFQQNFRMSREAFDKLQGFVTNIFDQAQIPTVSLKRDLLAVIWLLATPDSYRSIAERFDLAKSSLFGAFVKIIYSLRLLAKTIIKWPNQLEMVVISNGFERMSGIKNIIGAIDGSYVKIDAPAEDQEAYINRKCYHSVTLQAICDHKLKFTDCFTGYPSSVHDCRIFRNSPIYHRIQQNQSDFFPQNQFILGDKAYPSMMWCLVPFKRNQALTEAQTNFNKKHSGARTTVERAFALLFGRFRRLKHLQMKRMDLIPKTIIASCVLHNICLEFPDSIVYTQEELAAVSDQGDDEIVNQIDTFENSGPALEMRQTICDQLANRI